MTPRDWELLDRQLHELPPAPRREGTMVLALVAVFFVGVTLGSFLFHPASEPSQIAANKASPALALAMVQRQ
jgi:hypothetical protein